MDPDVAADVVKRLAYEFVAECFRWDFAPAELVEDAIDQIEAEYAAEGAEPATEDE